MTDLILLLVFWVVGSITTVVVISAIWILLNAKIVTLKEDMKTLKAERHKNTSLISEIKGSNVLLTDDVALVKSKMYLLEQLKEYIRELKAFIEEEKEIKRG